MMSIGHFVLSFALRVILLGVALHIVLPGYSQSNTLLDSLRLRYEQSSYQQGEKFINAGLYARALFFNGQQQEAMDLLAANTAIAAKQKDGKFAAYLYGARALNARVLDDLGGAARFIDSAKFYAAKITDLEIKGYVLYCEGWLFSRNNDEVNAVRSFVLALQLLDKVSSTKYRGAVYKELYGIYTNWSAFELQKKYALLNLDLAVQAMDPPTLFDAYMLMGRMYEDEFRRNHQPVAIRDSAQYYYRASINTYETYREKMSIPSNLAHATINLANLYLEFYPDNQRDTVEKYAALAIEISTETEQYSFLASAYGILSDLARRDGDSGRAKNYLLNALASIQRETLPNHEIIVRIYQSLSEIFESEGDYEKALHYHQLYVSLFGEIYNAEKMALGQRLEAQFEKEKQQQQLTQFQIESEKKEQQIRLMTLLTEKQQQELELMALTTENNQQELALLKLQNLQKEQQLQSARREMTLQTRINRFYIILAIIALAMATLLLYAYRQRSRTLKQQKHLHHLEMEQARQQTAISNLNSMLNGQEQERTRLARDLHDGLGGLLSGMKIELSAIHPKLEGSHTKSKISSSLAQLDMAVNELRRVAHNLMPELLLKYGLAESLREYCNRMSSNQLEVDVQIVNYTNELATNRQVVVYRIIQELVNNAVKHASASQVLVQLAQTEDAIFLTIEDDGKGFDINSLDGRNSAGMHNVQSRLNYLNGKLHIDSRAGMGTTVEIEFPIINE